MAHARTSGSLSVVTLIATTLIAGCATPARKLPRSQIDDPMSLPKRMARVYLGGSKPIVGPGDGSFFGTFSWGATDRLQLDGLVPRYTFLDDAPAEASGHAPDAIGLSVWAGVEGIGFSSLDGFISIATAGTTVRRRLSPRFSVSLSASNEWDYRERAQSRSSRPAANGGLLYQLSPRHALELTSTSYAYFSGLTWSRWYEYGSSVWGVWSVRPWRWLTLSAFAAPSAWTWRWIRTIPPAPDTPANQLESGFTEKHHVNLRLGGSAALAW